MNEVAKAGSGRFRQNSAKPIAQGSVPKFRIIFFGVILMSSLPRARITMPQVHTNRWKDTR